MSDPIALFLVEDQPALLKELLRSLARDPRVAVRGSAMSGEAALEALRETSVDVVLLDLELPGIDGVAVCRELKRRSPRTEILMFTAFEDEERVFAAMAAGASGYLIKKTPLPSLLAAIVEVHVGGAVIDAALARRFWNHFESVAVRSVAPETASTAALTEREQEVLRLLARGFTNAQVGRALELERRAVKTHLGHIYTKLGVRSQVEAVVAALRAGIIEL